MSHATHTPSFSLAAIDTLLEKELEAVNDHLMRILSSQIPAMETIIRHLIASGGKRIRPKLLLLSGQACGCPPHDARLAPFAAIVECVHTASLLHDDVIDESDERRGQPTANQQWGNSASVLAGDFLYSRSFQTLLELGNLPIMHVLAQTTNQLTEGELLQLFASQDNSASRETYYQIIEAKTAALFRSSCQIGSMIAQPENTAQHQALADFGYHLGMAFQITDDLLDYTGDPAVTGKPQGSDLAQGKITLPLILALENLTQDDSAQRLASLKANGLDALPDVLAFIHSTQAIADSLSIAKEHGSQAKNALHSLPSTPSKDRLIELVEFACQRKL